MEKARNSDPAAAFDTESVSSFNNSGAQDCVDGGGGGRQGQRGPRGKMVPVRFWQEANKRFLGLPEPYSPSSKVVGIKPVVPPKFIGPKKIPIDIPVSYLRGVVTCWGQSSPILMAIRPASPSRLQTSATSTPLRGMSPSRMRNAVADTPFSNLSNTPSILSFAADIRRVKIGDNRIVEQHLLRLLHNRFLR